jgi:hypothetical protein
MQLDDKEKPNESTEASDLNDFYQKFVEAIPLTTAFGKTFLSEFERTKIIAVAN